MKADKRLEKAYKIAIKGSRLQEQIPNWETISHNAMEIFKEMTDKVRNENKLNELRDRDT